MTKMDPQDQVIEGQGLTSWLIHVHNNIQIINKQTIKYCQTENGTKQFLLDLSAGEKLFWATFDLSTMFLPGPAGHHLRAAADCLRRRV